MTNPFSRRALLASLPAFAATLAGSTRLSLAQNVVGDRHEIVIPSNPGGGNDLYARFIAKMIAPHLEGEPTINILNKVGGGGVVAANYFSSLPPDTPTSLVVSTGMLMGYAVNRKDEKIQYDIADWEPLLVSPTNYVVYVKKSSGIDSVKALSDNLDKELVIGMGGPLTGNFMAFLSLDLLGLNLKPVFGIAGGENLLAFERGEFNLMIDTVGEYLGYSQGNDDIFPLFTIGVADENDKIQRDSLLPDVMTFEELYFEVHGKEFTGDGADIWRKLFPVTNTASKSLALRAGVPTPVLQEFQSAVQEMLNDPAWQAEAAAIIGDYPQRTGELAQRTLRNVSSFSEEDAAWIRAWYSENYGITEL